MPELAKLIEIDKNTGKVTVDGVEFPWYIGESVSVQDVASRRITGVSVEILAEDVRLHAARYDNGGKLDPAETVVRNETGTPEQIHGDDK